MTDPLSRVRAGLARDTEIARAAIDSLRRDMDPSLRYEGDVGSWIAKPGPDGAGVRSVDGEIREEGEPESWRGHRQVIFSGDGQPTSAAAEHIAKFDPSRVLRQTEALQEVLNIIGRAIEWEERDPKAAYADIVSALASIYPEDTTETTGVSNAEG
ncbi:DUF6221 family protein [Nocardia sp. CA-290969]|uniref:DUF6221 family protein n=1 Tax=Nocardia sp. CA-290969 TaxID=3239986 RepID=UPI003D8F2167